MPQDVRNNVARLGDEAAACDQGRERTNVITAHGEPELMVMGFSTPFRDTRLHDQLRTRFCGGLDTDSSC
jgi:hypothetical protein